VIQPILSLCTIVESDEDAPLDRRPDRGRPDQIRLERVGPPGLGLVDGARMIEGAPVLVLTRRANQSIMIGRDVVITVLEIRGDQVRLGIRAPRSVEVHREEVFLEVTRSPGPAPAGEEEGGGARPPGAA